MEGSCSYMKTMIVVIKVKMMTMINIISVTIKIVT